MVRSTFQCTTEEGFLNKISGFPSKVRPTFDHLRAMVHDVAERSPEIYSLTETLKWGEPSFITPKGSTLRIDWKPGSPDHVQVFFKCTSKLVPTFRQVFPKDLDFVDNRALLIPLHQDYAHDKVAQCIHATLHYHRVKKLPLLGMNPSLEL